jgi:hypothetical protein
MLKEKSRKIPTGNKLQKQGKDNKALEITQLGLKVPSYVERI